MADHVEDILEVLNKDPATTFVIIDEVINEVETRYWGHRRPARRTTPTKDCRQSTKGLRPCSRPSRAAVAGTTTADLAPARKADHHPSRAYYKSVMLAPLNRHVRDHKYDPSAVFAEVRNKARPPPMPDTCGSLSPSPGCRIVSSSAAVVPPPPRRHFLGAGSSPTQPRKPRPGKPRRPQNGAPCCSSTPRRGAETCRSTVFSTACGPVGWT